MTASPEYSAGWTTSVGYLEISKGNSAWWAKVRARGTGSTKLERAGNKKTSQEILSNLSSLSYGGSALPLSLEPLITALPSAGGKRMSV